MQNTGPNSRITIAQMALAMRVPSQAIKCIFALLCAFVFYHKRNCCIHLSMLEYCVSVVCICTLLARVKNICLIHAHDFTELTSFKHNILYTIAVKVSRTMHVQSNTV